MRKTVAQIVDHPLAQRVVMWVIVFNAGILGLETSATVMSVAGPAIHALDALCLYFFCAEVLAKLYAHRLSFFKNYWNIFDFLIISVALVPATNGLQVLRALRILRVLRVISTAPRLRRVVEGFLTALPGMASVFFLMSLIFYIGAVMATKLFGTQFPQWFGTLGQSGYSLFQIMTLESWSMGIVRPVMEVYPYAWMFFVPFIMVTTFAVVNLLVGLIVNSMQDAHHEESDAQTHDYRDEVLARLAAIEMKLSEKDKT